ncbi:MAG: APC family permease [Proteobacteria bacterium]|nr:APC family permease [Pseudomonadota bacterium]
MINNDSLAPNLNEAASSSTTTQLKRSIGTFQLTLIGITSIIGSGWLFGAFHSAKIAGPAALLSWFIGAAALLLVALTIAEVGSLFPQSGGIARYLEYTHGSLSGFLSGWINWLGIVACLPTEAAASVQYLSSISGFKNLFDPTTGNMSHQGLVLSSILMVGYFLLNYWTLKLFLRSTTFVTLFKLIVPVISVLAIMWSGFHPGNFGHDLQTFAPYGFNAVFIAVAAGGVIFAFNGFQSIVNFAGEAKNPHRTIPVALISAILICLAIYLILQTGFIGALTPQDLANGWHGLNFSSPFVQLAISFNLNAIALLLYVDAVISPSGTGIAYMGSTARMLFGMQRSGYMPKFVGDLHPKYLIPRNAMWVSLILGFVFLWIFRGWGNLANVISIMNTLSYAAGPLAAAGLRYISPNWRSPCRIPGMKIIAPLSFIVISLIVYWSRWPLTGEVLLVVFAGLIIYFYFQLKNKGDIKMHLKSGIWFVCYLLVMALLSWLGSQQFGGIDLLKGPYDQIAVALVALLFYRWSLRSAWLTPLLQAFQQDKHMV